MSEDDVDDTGEGSALGGAEGNADTRIVRGRELARLLRRQAYQRAKELRAKDPKHLAMKQLAKEKRREAYRAVKEKRKAEQSAERALDKKETTTRKANERAARDGELKKLLTRGRTAPSEGKESTAEPPVSSAEDRTEVDEERTRAALMRAREPKTRYDIN